MMDLMDYGELIEDYEKRQSEIDGKMRPIEGAGDSVDDSIDEGIGDSADNGADDVNSDTQSDDDANSGDDTGAGDDADPDKDDSDKDDPDKDDADDSKSDDEADSDKGDSNDGKSDDDAKDDGDAKKDESKTRPQQDPTSMTMTGLVTDPMVYSAPSVAVEVSRKISKRHEAGQYDEAYEKALGVVLASATQYLVQDADARAEMRKQEAAKWRDVAVLDGSACEWLEFLEVIERKLTAIANNPELDADDRVIAMDGVSHRRYLEFIEERKKKRRAFGKPKYYYATMCKKIESIIEGIPGIGGELELLMKLKIRQDLAAETKMVWRHEEKGKPRDLDDPEILALKGLEEPPNEEDLKAAWWKQWQDENPVNVTAKLADEPDKPKKSNESGGKKSR